MKKELWKVIKNTYYEISNLGNVRNLITKNLLTVQQVGGKYDIPTAYVNLHGEKYYIGRLVYHYFVRSLLKDTYIGYKDNNPLNNKAENLFETSSLKKARIK